MLPLVNLIVAEFIEIAADHYAFLRNCPPTPSPKPTFCPKWDVSVNVGLGEGYVGSFPETYNDPPVPGVQIVECGEKSYSRKKKIRRKRGRGGAVTPYPTRLSLFFLFTSLCAVPTIWTPSMEQSITDTTPKFRKRKKNSLSRRL